MASGSEGHCPTHDRVNSSASHGGLDARICDVADTNPSLRSTSAECFAACAAGAVSGEPVHGGNAANTAIACDGAQPRGVFQIGNVPVDQSVRLRRRCHDNGPSIVQGGRKRPVDVVVVGSGSGQQNRRHAA